jgi:hypothetical protein
VGPTKSTVGAARILTSAVVDCQAGPTNRRRAGHSLASRTGGRARPPPANLSTPAGTRRSESAWHPPAAVRRSPLPVRSCPRFSATLWLRLAPPVPVKSSLPSRLCFVAASPSQPLHCSRLSPPSCPPCRRRRGKRASRLEAAERLGRQVNFFAS